MDSPPQRRPTSHNSAQRRYDFGTRKCFRAEYLQPYLLHRESVRRQGPTSVFDTAKAHIPASTMLHWDVADTMLAKKLSLNKIYRFVALGEGKGQHVPSNIQLLDVQSNFAKGIDLPSAHQRVTALILTGLDTEHTKCGELTRLRGTWKRELMMEDRATLTRNVLFGQVTAAKTNDAIAADKVDLYVMASASIGGMASQRADNSSTASGQLKGGEAGDPEETFREPLIAETSLTASVTGEELRRQTVHVADQLILKSGCPTQAFMRAHDRTQVTIFGVKPFAVTLQLCTVLHERQRSNCDEQRKAGMPPPTPHEGAHSHGHLADFNKTSPWTVYLVSVWQCANQGHSGFVDEVTWVNMSTSECKEVMKTPYHPLAISLGHRIHGWPMWHGVAAEAPTDIFQFSAEAINVTFEFWYVNKWRKAWRCLGALAVSQRPWLAVLLCHHGVSEEAVRAVEARWEAGAVSCLPPIEHEINVINTTEQAIFWRRVYGPTPPKQGPLAAAGDVGPVETTDSLADINALVSEFWNLDSVRTFTNPSLGKLWPT